MILLIFDWGFVRYTIINTTNSEFHYVHWPMEAFQPSHDYYTPALYIQYNIFGVVHNYP